MAAGAWGAVWLGTSSWGSGWSPPLPVGVATLFFKGEEWTVLGAHTWFWDGHRIPTGKAGFHISKPEWSSWAPRCGWAGKSQVGPFGKGLLLCKQEGTEDTVWGSRGGGMCHALWQPLGGVQKQEKSGVPRGGLSSSYRAPSKTPWNSILRPRSWWPAASFLGASVWAESPELATWRQSPHRSGARSRDPCEAGSCPLLFVAQAQRRYRSSACQNHTLF